MLPSGLPFQTTLQLLTLSSYSLLTSIKTLYTILGSDLPPRHAPNQTLTNLRFLIDNEDLNLPSFISDPPPSSKSSFTSSSHESSSSPVIPLFRFRRHYLLNRQLASPTRTAIISLLDQHGLSWSEIPFSPSYYRTQPFRWDGLGLGGGRWGFGGSDVDPEFYTSRGMKDGKLSPTRWGWKELDWALNDKNLYAMHNNGGRNEALRLSFEDQRTRWAIPLDSNCAFTRAGLVGLMDTIIEAENLRRDDEEGGDGDGQNESLNKEYIVIPMARLLGNEEFFKWNQEPDWDVLKGMERGRERTQTIEGILDKYRPLGKC